MDARIRSRRGLLGIFVLLVAACSGASSTGVRRPTDTAADCNGGKSAAPCGSRDRRDSRAVESKLVPSQLELPANFRTVLARVNAAPVPSRGHAGGRWTVTAYVSRGARASYGKAELPAGSVVALEHFEADGSPGPIFAMRKLGASWSFSASDASSRVVRSGEPAECLQCHRLAAHDHLFGLGAENRDVSESPAE